MTKHSDSFKYVYDWDNRMIKLHSNGVMVTQLIIFAYFDGNWILSRLNLIVICSWFFPTAAIQALKRKKRFEKQLQQIDGTLSTIEMQREALEGANTNTAVLTNMKSAADALKAAHQHMYVTRLFCSNQMNINVWNVNVRFVGMSIKCMTWWMILPNNRMLPERFRMRFPIQWLSVWFMERFFSLSISISRMKCFSIFRSRCRRGRIGKGARRTRARRIG